MRRSRGRPAFHCDFLLIQGHPVHRSSQPLLKKLRAILSCCIHDVLLALQRGALITFAPFHSTVDAYKELQQCVLANGSGVDYIIYQTYGDPRTTMKDQLSELVYLQTGELESICNAIHANNTTGQTIGLFVASGTMSHGRWLCLLYVVLFLSVASDLLAVYSPSKLVAGVASSAQQRDVQLLRDVIKPLIANGSLAGAAVFDADSSLRPDLNFSTETYLWGS